MTKECKFCESILPFSMFGKSSNHKDGRENTCKNCRRTRKPKHIITCKQCNSDFISDKKTNKFCNAECAGLNRRNRLLLSCEQCGNVNEVVKSKTEIIKMSFCNQACRNEHMKINMLGSSNPNYIRIDYECDGCNKSIKVTPSRVEVQKYIFCDNNCYKSNIGKYFSGRDASNYNHELTQEERMDTRKYKEYYEWRTSVYVRDQYTCKSCGDDKGGNLIAHHILNYSEHKELRVDIKNGITLCVLCHRGFHNEYGYKYNNETQLNEFMQRILIP